MDDRLGAVAAVLVGGALAVVGAAEYVAPGLAPPSLDPLVTGVLVAGGGLLLLAAGGLALSTPADPLSLRAATAVGLVTLALAVLQPGSLLFGGVFWLALVATGLIAAGAYGTARAVR